ncbi:MAG: PH domain-containing protein, partial [Candidatus Sumerlaeaceae bacterium]|nr:PH domain-containing protein [Candidatus Sumerlaeaceae bacterium]
MMQALMQWLVFILKLPPEPPAPFGEERSLRVFRASPQFLKYQYVMWGIGFVVQCVFLACGLVALIVGMYAAKSTLVSVALGAFTLFIVVAFTVSTVLSLLSMRLHYEIRWYKVTDRSLRIREGVFFVREMTMTFVNIQNIEISQGPIQRLLGISDLKVQTAGGGGATAPHHNNPGQGQQFFNMHIGYFR